MFNETAALLQISGMFLQRSQPQNINFQLIAAKIKKCLFSAPQDGQLSFFRGGYEHYNDPDAQEASLLLRDILGHYISNGLYPDNQHYQKIFLLIKTTFEYHLWRQHLNWQNGPTMTCLVQNALQNNQGNFPEMAALLRIMFQYYGWANPPDCCNFEFPQDNEPYPGLEDFLGSLNLNIQKLQQLMRDQDNCANGNNFFWLLVTIYNNKIERLDNPDRYLPFACHMKDNNNRDISDIYGAIFVDQPMPGSSPVISILALHAPLEFDEEFDEGLPGSDGELSETDEEFAPPWTYSP